MYVTSFNDDEPSAVFICSLCTPCSTLDYYTQTFLKKCLFLREREGEHTSMSRGGAEREGDRGRPCADSREPASGHELTNGDIMT